MHRQERVILSPRCSGNPLDRITSNSSALHQDPQRGQSCQTEAEQATINRCGPVRRKIPATSNATNIKSQLKLCTPDDKPLSLPRPRKPIHLLCPLLASLTSICPVSSLVMTCSKERGGESHTLPVSSNCLKSCCNVCPAPSASRPRNLRA